MARSAAWRRRSSSASTRSWSRSSTSTATTRAATRPAGRATAATSTAIAGAFHDLEAFASLDYLAPSIRAQDDWLERTGRGAWADELAVVIAEHHRPTRYRGAHAALAEAFRVADLADVSQGLVHPGIARADVKAVRAAFDVGPFFTRVVPMAVLRNLARRPLDPLPHMRARRALARSGHGGADG